MEEKQLQFGKGNKMDETHLRRSLPPPQCAPRKKKGEGESAVWLLYKIYTATFNTVVYIEW